jgi:hypothetical protein
VTINHWHVTRHSDDEDPWVGETIFGALDYARTELDDLADMEHAMVSDVASRVDTERHAAGRAGLNPYEMEEALLSFAKAERYNGLMLNAANMVKQRGMFYADRAPLYQVDSRDWEKGEAALADARDAADARLHQAALHTAREINENSPLGIWDCTAELRTWPDNDPMHGGESYCADEYPDGYADDVDSDPIGRDEPAGDH